MLTENGIQVDLEALNGVLEKGDIITIGFTLFAERMLVDTRTNATDGVYCQIVEPVGNVQERYMWLGKHRSSFGAPEGFAFFVWPHTVRTLVKDNVLGTLRDRLERIETGSGRKLDAALGEALRKEMAGMAIAINGGEGWATVWQRGSAPADPR